MKYTIEATIPVVQYGNIKPLIQVESEEDEVAAIDTIKRLWNRFGESPVKDKHESNGVRIETFTGEVVFFNEHSHVYKDLAGNVLLSGSAYADKNSPKFDIDSILPKTAKSWEVEEGQLKHIWNEAGDISTSFGSAVHKALELYHNLHQIGGQIQEKKKTDYNYVLPKSRYIRDLVLKFEKSFGLDAMTEVVVSDVANGMVGTIDRLAVNDKKEYRVGDYKTNAELDAKKKLRYQKQLSYYAHILMNKGFKVTGLDLFYIDDNDEWVKEELDVLPLE